MALTCFLLVLGLVIVSAMADDTTTKGIFSSDTSNPFTAEAATSTTNTSVTSSISNTTSDMNITHMNSITPSPTTKQRDSGGETPAQASQKPPQKSLTQANPVGPQSTSGKTTTAAPQTRSDTTGIIIFIVVIIMAVVFGAACYFLRKRESKSYSVDFTARQDEANIPLSTVEPELPGDTVPQNGLQTFESRETITEKPQHSEENPEGQEEQKPEGENPADPSPGSVAQVPPADSSGDKPKEDVAEHSSLAPVQPTVEDKTDDEGGISNQTSVESLKETNENNSNSVDISQWRDPESSSIFWEIPLDCPV